MNPTKAYCLCCLMLIMHACQTKQQVQGESPLGELTIETAPSYPESLSQIFNAHGGIDKWNVMNSLYFEIEDEKGNEKHYIQLEDRRDRVEGNQATMGFDGTNIWVEADTSYKRDPIFYHNLMFYFYAMPFVLGDEGIVYADAAPLEFDGVSYPGVRISYEEGIGASSKDEYFVHYDPETSQMAWLGYTVTYFSQEESQDVHWIRYDNWQDVGALKLPKAISWYTYEEGLPVELRNVVSFTKVTISEEPHPDELFHKPPNAEVKE